MKWISFLLEICGIHNNNLEGYELRSLPQPRPTEEERTNNRAILPIYEIATRARIFNPLEEISPEIRAGRFIEGLDPTIRERILSINMATNLEKIRLAKELNYITDQQLTNFGLAETLYTQDIIIRQQEEMIEGINQVANIMSNCYDVIQNIKASQDENTITLARLDGKLDLLYHESIERRKEIAATTKEIQMTVRKTAQITKDTEKISQKFDLIMQKIAENESKKQSNPINWANQITK